MIAAASAVTNTPVAATIPRTPLRTRRPITSTNAATASATTRKLTSRCVVRIQLSSVAGARVPGHADDADGT